MKIIIFISAIVFLISCKENTHVIVGELPSIRDIDSLKETDFVGTIENKFKESKNYIYSPTLSFAWNEIQDTLKRIEIINTAETEDLMLLHNTKSNINSLNKNEYKSTISISGNNIVAKSEFNIELIFEPFLEKFVYPITFKNNEVEGFGMSEWDEAKARKVEIIYYKDDDNFIFKLLPKNNNIELVFIRGLNSEKSNSFEEVLKILSDKKTIAEKERKNKKLEWKYTLVYDESFGIPEMSFNIKKSFKTIVGQHFLSQKVVYKIIEAQQQNGLLLNNKGAKIESDAIIETPVPAASDEPIKRTKHLFLDDTFFLIIKHTDRDNPFFCAKIDNTELMNRRQEK